jgi:hypothetical protein
MTNGCGISRHVSECWLSLTRTLAVDSNCTMPPYAPSRHGPSSIRTPPRSTYIRASSRSEVKPERRNLPGRRGPPEDEFKTSLHTKGWTLPKYELARIATIVEGGWAVRTRKNHAGSAARFRSFCRECDVPRELTFPVAEPVLCAWLASMHGIKSGSTARNELAGLRAWHVRCNVPFPASERVTKILESIEHHRPARSRLPLRSPVTLDMIRVLVDKLSEDPTSFNLAVLACALAAFWGQFRLGELLPTSRATFTPDLYPTRSSWGSPSGSSIALPWTKTTKSRGSVVRLPSQASRTCPVAAVTRYLRKFPAPSSSALFSFSGPDGMVRPLTKKAFLDYINSVWARHRFPRITGHAFRIGGTTELLRQGVDPEIMKVSGRWSSDSFLRYWRKTDEVLPRHLDNVVISSRRRAAPRG